METGIESTVEERARDIAAASACYSKLAVAIEAAGEHEPTPARLKEAAEGWPWAVALCEPHATPTENLVRIGALCAVAIDHLHSLERNRGTAPVAAPTNQKA